MLEIQNDKIPMKCHDGKFIYSFIHRSGQMYSEYTGWVDGYTYIYRYCAACHRQMGYIDFKDQTDHIADFEADNIKSDELDKMTREWSNGGS